MLNKKPIYILVFTSSSHPIFRRKNNKNTLLFKFGTFLNSIIKCYTLTVEKF